MKKFLLLTALCAVAPVSVMADGDQVPFPEGYRTWYHHHTTVNLPGHSPEANMGIQHVYANAAARDGLKTGKYADGAAFAVDRFKTMEGDNNTTKQGDRKVIATMIRNATKYAETGGWGFEAFKGGDPNQRVVKDMKACFVCHIPHEATSYVISKGE
ncbi:MAG: cytochrome P460 family protein [Burkholderiales bacterium]